MEDKMRIDKWLWSVRLYKTRSMAADACSKGIVYIGGSKAKASSSVKEGDIVKLAMVGINREYEVLKLLRSRVSASLVPEYMNEITAYDVIENWKIANKVMFERRDRGIGRPTKKDRRDIDKLKDL